MAALLLDHVAQLGQLGVACSIHLLGGGQQCGQPVAVLDEVLLPADEVHVAQQHLDLAADQQGFKGRVVDIDIGDVDFLDAIAAFDAFGKALDVGQHGFNVFQLPLHRQREGRHGALHALEHVHPQQMDQAFFAVGLAEEALAAPDLGAVLGVVSGLLVRQHVAQRGVAGQVQASDFKIDVLDGPELACQVHVGLDVDGRQPVRELAGLVGAVVALNMPARAGDGEVVQQGEVVEAQHFHQVPGRAFGIVQVQPAVELGLGLARGLLDAGYAVLQQRRVVAFRRKGNLVAQVSQPVVDGCGRQHQHAGLDAFLDDLAHQPVIARLVALARRLLVAEVVAFVNDHQVVVAPVHVGQVNVARQAAVARQIGVVEHVVIQPVSGQHIALVVGFVKRPVVAQAFGCQHQHAVIAQLVVLDDRQRLECFAQAHAVRDDAAAKAGQLVDGTHHAVTLELEKLLPDHCIADACGGLDDLLFVQRVTLAAEDVVQDQGIYVKRRLVLAHSAQRRHQVLLGGFFLVGLGLQRSPLLIEPLRKLRGLGR